MKIRVNWIRLSFEIIILIIRMEIFVEIHVYLAEIDDKNHRLFRMTIMYLDQ